MIAGPKASLDYYTTQLRPLPAQQFRILEFPALRRRSRRLSRTRSRIRSRSASSRACARTTRRTSTIPYYVTAHEAAHQWWAHQVIGGDVQGSTLLSETLAQYSALMVMKKKYGEAKMQKFLDYELDRYLVGRSTEQKKELPLGRVENQPYIHYRKGSLVMYALADYIGEDNLNRAIRAFATSTRSRARRTRARSRWSTRCAR
jgi:aminopeptidase N